MFTRFWKKFASGRGRRKAGYSAGPELVQAIADARSFAVAGLVSRPYYTVCTYTLDQLALIEAAMATDTGLRGLAPGTINVGMMAVKELGQDDAAFAHALHVIQRAVNEATGKRD